MRFAAVVGTPAITVAPGASVQHGPASDDSAAMSLDPAWPVVRDLARSHRLTARERKASTNAKAFCRMQRGTKRVVFQTVRSGTAARP